MKFVNLLIVMLLVSGSTFVHAGQSEQERKAKQAELDAICEAARQKMIVLERAKHIEECVQSKQQADRAACERYYANYGQRAGGQAPLFYDLPQCEEAHAYRTSYRSSNR
jgi:hypothetical protein